MRKVLIASLAVTAALIVVAAATGRSTAPTTRATAAAIPGCAKDQLGLLDPAALTIGADNPPMRPNDDATPMPVVRNAVGYSSGVYA